MESGGREQSHRWTESDADRNAVLSGTWLARAHSGTDCPCASARASWAFLLSRCFPAMVVNESQWEESTGFFPFCPPTVLSPGLRAGRHALEGQGNGDLILTTNSTNLTNGRAVFWVSPHNLVVISPKRQRVGVRFYSPRTRHPNTSPNRQRVGALVWVSLPRTECMSLGDRRTHSLARRASVPGVLSAIEPCRTRPGSKSTFFG